MNELSMNELVVVASHSENSINKKLATYAATKVANARIELLDIDDFEIPI